MLIILCLVSVISNCLNNKMLLKCQAETLRHPEGIKLLLLVKINI